MSRAIPTLFSLNRGVVDRRGLARLDVKRLALAAEVQTNWLPRVLGPMSLRPGMGYLGATRDNVATRFLRFIFATDDLALLELTEGFMRVWINDVILSRPAVATTIVNPLFTSDLTGWTDLDEGSAVSSWAGGKMQLVGTGTAHAIREQHVACTTPNVEHGLRITIARGPVTLRIGSTSGDDDYLGETTLAAGTHSLSILPSGDFYVRFLSSQRALVLVDECSIEAAGVVMLPTPWQLADLGRVRYDQSADVVFVACRGFQQRRIERRGTRPGARGWSVVLYQSPDGPFQLENTTPTTLTPSAITGNVTVTASTGLFRASQVGALFAITSVGQATEVDASAANSYTDSVRVTGLAPQRAIAIAISGTFVGTVVLQQSFDNAVWGDVAGETWTGPVVVTYNDNLDNAIVYYRIGIEAAYTSGTAHCELSFPQGSIRGVVRVTNYLSPMAVSAEVIQSLGGTAPSSSWEESKWSGLRGWPTAVALHDGRLWWMGQNGVQGSISDAYDSYDPTFAGDAGPINRTIGSGPVDAIPWALSLKGLMIGAQGAEHSIRASSLDEVITPTSFNIRATSTQGSGDVSAAKVDQSGYFIDRTGCKVFELAFDARSYDYGAVDLMELVPELGLPGIVRLDVQRKPDTRFHAVRSDGVVLLGVINRQEDVLAWIPLETSGAVEDVVVMPAAAGALDDQVYYVVRRTINGATARYLEKVAQEIDCRGDKALCLLADSFVTRVGPPSTMVSAPHLEGQEVVVWADGVDIGTDDSGAVWTQRYSVTDGVLMLPKAASSVVVGLPYAAQFRSAKLGVQGNEGAVLNQEKKIGHMGLVLADTHRRGVRFGPAFDYLDDMPQIEQGAPVTVEVAADYDENPIEFPGQWTNDMRVCLVAQAPRPATVMAVTIDVVQNS